MKNTDMNFKNTNKLIEELIEVYSDKLDCLKNNSGCKVKISLLIKFISDLKINYLYRI
jgi:hypothetical protein